MSPRIKRYAPEASNSKSGDKWNERNLLPNFLNVHKVVLEKKPQKEMFHFGRYQRLLKKFQDGKFVSCYRKRPKRVIPTLCKYTTACRGRFLSRPRRVVDSIILGFISWAQKKADNFIDSYDVLLILLSLWSASMMTS